MSDPVTDLKQELLAAADRRHEHAPLRAGRSRPRGRPGRKRLLLASATVSIAAAAALVFTAPWGDSPSFLERAQAALAQDAGVLHATWEETTTPTDPACTVRRGLNEIWIDLTPPYRYRAFLHDFPADPASTDPAAHACSGGAATELGGTFDPLQTFRFVPPNMLDASPLLLNMPPDPAVEFREAIDDGRAHDEGDAELRGRTVRRIRVDPPPCPDRDCPREPGYVYVDPETFHPVEIRGPAGSDASSRVHIATRYLIYEYLPRTPANLALTDIQAQHPNAAGP